MEDELRLFLVTANVGTIFENLNDLLEPWLSEFSRKIDQLKPDFVALHMQEIGGKNYKDSIQSINPFFKKFLSNPTIRTFNRYLIVVDSDFTDELTFTSLGSVYLISERLKENDVELFDFDEKLYFNYVNRQIFTGNLNKLHLIYKERFVRNYFPEFQWSRKGFVQTKWRLKNQNYDFVNIHLFHDPSNLIALNSTPSIYSQNRKRALKYSIDKIETNRLEGEKIVYSIFGDFNFRLDLASLINDFGKKSEFVETKDKNNKTSRLVCKTSKNEELFVIEEKKFKWEKSSAIQGLTNELLKYDIELSLCEVELHELVRKFPPSYPFSEELDRPEEYMESRCPSWCDRIVLNHNLKQILDSRATSVEYSMLGENTCMGDHKPIFLYFIVNNVKNDDVNPVKSSASRSTTSSSQNMINIGLKFVYINNSLANMEKSSTDIHDHALFKDPSCVRHLEEFCHTYPKYVIGPSSTSIETHLVSLNQWLKSIVDFLVLARRNNLDWCSSMLREQSSPNCDSPDAAVNTFCLRSSILIRFFLQAPLNGNFFKLKHLYAFLDRTLASMSESVSDYDGPIEAADESSRPFDCSPRSAFLLREVLNFLKTPCVYTVFKMALVEKRCQGEHDDPRKVLVNNTNTSNNNNDENFSNMNMSDAKIKTIIGAVSANNGAVSPEAEVIRSPLNGNY